jgi:hypothetical protein
LRGALENDFLQAFNYTDTVGQSVVWEELKKDLEGDFPMSRLLCGDVGFGKTELALRASFRVVVNGGQVVVLCPTSVLVNQHLNVFTDRLSNFGVNVAGLVGGLGVTKKNKIKVDWVDKKIDVLILFFFVTPKPPTKPPTFTPKLERRSVKTFKCWFTKTEVGHKTTTCPPLTTTRKEALRANSVFPKPTSPHSRRDIGKSPSKSFFNSSQTTLWPTVSV